MDEVMIAVEQPGYTITHKGSIIVLELRASKAVTIHIAFSHWVAGNIGKDLVKASEKEHAEN